MNRRPLTLQSAAESFAAALKAEDEAKRALEKTQLALDQATSDRKFMHSRLEAFARGGDLHPCPTCGSESVHHGPEGQWCFDCRFPQTGKAVEVAPGVFFVRDGDKMPETEVLR